MSILDFSIIKDGFRKEKGMVWTGTIGILLGLVGIFFLLFHGNEIPPEGKWSKAITFDLGIGIFSLTTAVVAPLIPMSEKQRKRFRYSLITSAWMGYALETIQNARGFDPRFTKAGTFLDMLAGVAFGVVCIMLAGAILFAIIRLLKEDASQNEYNLSLRYAFFSNLLGVFSGVWMILIQGRVTEDGIDIMILHFIGFHGYQAIPIIAWMLNQANVAITQTQRAIHWAGWTWFALYVFLSFQFAWGNPLFEPTIYSILALISLIFYLVIAVYSGLCLFLRILHPSSK